MLTGFPCNLNIYNSIWIYIFFGVICFWFIWMFLFHHGAWFQPYVLKPKHRNWGILSYYNLWLTLRFKQVELATKFKMETWNINSRWQTSVFPLKFTHYQNKKIKSTKGHFNMITVTVHFGSRGFFNLKRLICLHWLESVVTFRPSFYKIQSTLFKTDTGTIVSLRLREMSIL